jgi:hypothetical protein
MTFFLLQFAFFSEEDEDIDSAPLASWWKIKKPKKPSRGVGHLSTRKKKVFF